MKPAGVDGLEEDSKYADIPAEYFETETTDFVVEPENWSALRLFMDCQTQWIYAGSIKLIRVGLDYSRLSAVMNMRGIRRQSRMFDAIQLIERGALAGFAEIPLKDL